MCDFKGCVCDFCMCKLCELVMDSGIFSQDTLFTSKIWLVGNCGQIMDSWIKFLKVGSGGHSVILI